MDMCGICVGYVWCEIRQQSSEEPCDETSFGKKDEFLVESWEMWIIQNVLSPLQGLSMIFEVLLVLSTLRRSKLATTPHQPGH